MSSTIIPVAFETGLAGFCQARAILFPSELQQASVAHPKGIAIFGVFVKITAP